MIKLSNFNRGQKNLTPVTKNNLLFPCWRNRFMMKRRTIIIFVLLVALASCASHFTVARAKQITPQYLSSIYSVDTTDHIVYCGSDSTYHYFHHSQLFGGGSYKIEKKVLHLPSEFSITDNNETVLLVGHYDKETNSWIQLGEFK